jgi:hypothetical protein
MYSIIIKSLRINLRDLNGCSIRARANFFTTFFGDWVKARLTITDNDAAILLLKMKSRGRII